MIQNIRSVFVGLTKEIGPDEPSSAVAFGLSLAQAAEAHLTVQAAAHRAEFTVPWVSNYAAGLLQAENTRLHRLAQTIAEKAAAAAAMAGVTVTARSPQLSYADLLASFTTLARLHDLSVIDAEPEAAHLDRDLIEALLVGSGRPLLVVPPSATACRAERIVIAWDASSRASRAVHDALPFLRAAEAVQIVAVSGEKDLPDAADGADLAPHLARHGVAVEVTCLAARDGDVAQTLRDVAASYRADMLVMGGYVHSRLREMVFGGVTQSLLRSSPLPLLMSY
ncbi:universal stress protein [Methylobacterium oryzisoli]|uniref:universal stress protein n=1 Tax=Methylobacterium oryzisoli TaxID=3385502 RepID=UPI003891C25A